VKFSFSTASVVLGVVERPSVFPSEVGDGEGVMKCLGVGRVVLVFVFEGLGGGGRDGGKEGGERVVGGAAGGRGGGDGSGEGRVGEEVGVVVGENGLGEGVVVVVSVRVEIEFVDWIVEGRREMLVLFFSPGT